MPALSGALARQGADSSATRALAPDFSQSALPRLAWGLSAVLLALLTLGPVVALAVSAARGDADGWAHLAAHVLPEAARQTGLLILAVGLIVTAIGVGCAWLVAAYDFPGRRVVEAALVLPLAVPTYIVAFAYLDLLHPLGPVQGALRALLGYARPSELILPDIRSLPGCALLLGLVLYPYVYLPVRAFFLMQGGTCIEAARCLGSGPARVFLRIALPLARPAIALGTGLALMEALNDVGAAEFLGVRTLTVQIYATWVNRSDLPGAAGLALGLLALVVALVAIERAARRGRGYAANTRKANGMARRRLAGWRGWAALAACLLPVALGFLAPAGHLAALAHARLAQHGLPTGLPAEIAATLLYAGLATVFCAGIGLLVAASPEVLGRRLGALLVRLAGLGYALPGVILAIGLLAWLGGLGAASGLPLAALALGSGGALVAAYLLRFLAIGAGAAETGLARVPPSLSDAARLLGHPPLAALRRIQIPLALPALASGALLVFVDCVKELPASLLLRPLNVETLATHVYAEAARGTYEDGALAALLIVTVGLIPVAILTRIGTDPRG